MGEELFYNRDRNLSGIADVYSYLDLNLTPVYGSKVDFTSKTFSYETTDSYYNTIPVSLNNIRASYKLRYDVNESGAQALTNFFENKMGYLPFSFYSDTSVYKNLSGFCENYSINHIYNDHYEFAAEIMVDQAPSLINWSGMTYLNFGLQQYQAGIPYKKYDVVYTGINSNKLNNFYYCTQDHTSTVPTCPTGASSLWTQDFFFEPDAGVQNDVKLQVKKVEWKSSFPLRIKTKKHIAPINIKYKFSSISTNQLKAMLHFLEIKAGYRKFKHQIPSVYNRPKVFSCAEWSHTWKFLDNHDLELSLIEDPIGIIQLDT